MIRHILRMVWNRKTSTALVLIEILISFLVVFAVTSFGVFFFQNARKPMGYEVKDVWYLYFRPANTQDESEEAIQTRRSLEELVYRELDSFDRIEQVSVIHPPPYRGWTNSTSWDVGDRKFRSELIWGSPEAREVLSLDIVEGRWFQEGDDQLAWKPVVINRKLAEEIFGAGEVLGHTVKDVDPEDPPEEQEEWRAIGVISDFRKAGEFKAPRNVTMHYLQPGSEDCRVFFLAFRVMPGTPAQFEEEILDRLQALAPSWSFSIKSLENEREDYRRTNLMQLLLASTVAGFLLLMVALGLLGVLWQTVTQRTQEIGVRRAKGAPAQKIHVQILGELMAVTGLAVVLGTLLLIQLPLTGWFDFLKPEVTLPAFLLAVTVMFGLTLISGLYPSWLATRVLPAEALHYE